MSEIGNPNRDMPDGKPLDPETAIPEGDEDAGGFGEDGEEVEDADASLSEAEKLDKAVDSLSSDPD